MQTYRQYQPTGFDAAGLAADRLEIGEFLVAPVIQTRDSGPLELSNFRSTLAALGGESDTVQVHRFEHWGPGWYEIILIDPTDATRVQTAEEIEGVLQDYPIVDEDDYSTLEWERATEYWERMCVANRVAWLQRHDRRVSVFAARRAELPEEMQSISELAE